MKTPEFPADAPFSDQQQAWLTGFLAGLRTQLAGNTKNSREECASTKPLHVLFGSQSGNAALVAEETCEAAEGMGLATILSDLNSTSMSSLQQVENAIFVVSTHGEGEMPDNAELFWEELSATTAPRLEHLNFGVLGLGDTDYDEFCQAAKVLDTRLEQLGASRLAERQDCDVDYEELASTWISDLLPLIQSKSPTESGLELASVPSDKQRSATKNKTHKWSKKNPFPSVLLDSRLLSRKGSKKEVRHYSLNLEASSLTYAPGDALNIIPENHSNLVDLILAKLQFSPDLEVEGFDSPLHTLLKTHFEIVTPTRTLFSEIASRAKQSEIRSLYESDDKAAKEKFLWGKDCLDLLSVELHDPLDANEFVGLLKPLQHRAYSISSSQQVYENEVHMTIASVRWMQTNREHRGVASTWLADEVKIGHPSPIFFTQNNNFRLPNDDSAPIIMVGPGTGIAPFRAFLQEREATGARGKNWLFFGDQHKDCDFLYEDEIGDWLDKGLLDKLDLAFSRDQQNKVYVQNRMIENSKHLYQWLEEGAYFYVCGDAERMAPDVENALLQIISNESGKGLDSANDYLKELKLGKRYLRDVY